MVRRTNAVSPDPRHRMDCKCSDAKLASTPCAYSTAENMLDRAHVAAETVSTTGASGGVDSAAVLLAEPWCA